MRHGILVVPVLVATCGTTTGPTPTCATFDPHRTVFWGDLHVHTARSLDAYLQGARATPDDAYRFALGEPLGIQPYDADGAPTRTIQLDRPLDFVSLTDHAEFLGAVDLCTTEGSSAYDEPECVNVRDNPGFSYLSLNAATAPTQDDARWPLLCGDDATRCIDAGTDVWTEVVDLADAYDDATDACTFTAFPGYEWSGGPNTQNLHRNVVFGTSTVPDLPASYFDAPYVDELWDALQDDCVDVEGCDVLTIPHNANLSSGLYWSTLETDDTPRTADDAAMQQFMEPMVEVMQHKGDGECWPGSPLADDACAFEKLPYNTLSTARLQIPGTPLPRDFVRDVLGEGLRYEAAMGVNPYRYAMTASTDTHLGAPGMVDEAGYPGHGGAGADNDETIVGLPDDPWFGPGGLVAVWAEENSREALFRAMRRGETYGTSGPRIGLRVFAGADLEVDACDPDALPEVGDRDGVPMGGTLPPDLSGAPTFALAALADLGTERRPGAGLDRVQVVKGWLDGDTVRTEVFDVLGGGVDTTLPDGTCAPPQGQVELCGRWTDAAFDPTVRAFWYVRVLEVETCRWTAHQCDAAGITCPTDDGDWAACCTEGLPRAQRERAWSSPIWYTPDDDAP